MVWIFSGTSRADWRPIGPYGGHALKIAIDPAEPSNLYVATKNGQVYRSQNGGKRWDWLPVSLNSGSALQAIVINPANPNQLYLGVAEGSGAITANAMGGVYQSEDGGQTWALLPGTQNWSVLSLAIHPKNPAMLVAGAMDGIYGTDNGGHAWRRISPANHPELKGVVSLALDPLDQQIIYAGTPHLPWRTMNGGTTWNSIHQGMIDDSDVFSIAVDRVDSSRIYASACSGIYRSGNRGNQWIKMQGIPGTNRRTHIILQDPVDEKTLYAGTTQGLWKSQDGGLTWQKVNPYPYVINSIAIDPSNHNQLFIATDRSGILKSLDGGRSFHNWNDGFINRNISRFLSEDALYLSSVYDGDFGGIFASSDGRSWVLKANQSALKGKNVISLAVSHSNPNLLLAGTYEGLLRSDNRGLTWNLVTGVARVPSGATARSRKVASFRASAKQVDTGVRLPEAKVYDVKFAMASPNTVNVATARGLFQSVDNGLVWNAIRGPVQEGAIHKIALHPTGTQWILAQSSTGLFTSQDQGQTWTQVELGVSGIRIHDSAVSPQQQNRILAATSHGLYESLDAGRSWTLNGNGLPIMPIHQICLLRQNPRAVYLLSQLNNQVYHSLDEGKSWSRMSSQGLNGLTVQALLAGPKDDEALYVLTENRGVYTYTPEATTTEGPVLSSGSGQ